MARVFEDVADDTLSAGISAGATSSTLVDASEFPATGDFSIRFEDASDPTVFEIVTATARSGNVITHAATASAWVAGDKVLHVLAKADLDEFLQETAAAATYQALSDKGANNGYASLDAGGDVPASQLGNAQPFIGCRAYRAAALSPAHGTATAIGYDNETVDTHGFHDNATNNTRFTIPTGLGGRYRVEAYVEYATNGTSERAVILVKNGSGEARKRRMGAVSTAQTGITLSDEIELAAGDYFEINAYQASGGALALSVGDLACSLALTYLGP